MKRSKFTEAQIAFILRQAEEGTAVGEACRKAGISEATYYNWRKQYAGLTPSEMKRLRLLRLPAHSHLSQSRRPPHERRSSLPAVAGGGAASGRADKPLLSDHIQGRELHREARHVVREPMNFPLCMKE